MRIIIFILAFTPIILLSQNVGISTDGSTPDPSALLDVKSTTQGMLVPRMTSTQRDLIATPVTGLLIFDTTLGAFHFYDGSIWQNLSEGAAVSDADGDTKIETEKNPDEDIVRISAGGNEILQIHSDRLDMNSYDDNTILGEDAAENISGANLSTIIGARAGRNFTGDYGVFVGVDAYKETQGQYNTAIGYQSAANDTFGYQNTFLGAEAGKNNIGYQSVLIGKGAGINNDASQAVSIGLNAGALNKGIGNIFIGTNAGIVSTGFNNLFIGNNAGLNNTSGGGNTYIGSNSGKNGNGFSNVHLGSGSGTKSLGSENVIIGDQAATNSTIGSNSVIIGSNAALWDTLSKNNVIIGSEAGQGGPNIGFKHMKKENVLIGERAGYAIQGNGNTALGYRAGHNATGYSNVFLGREAGASESGNDKLYISNTSSSEPLIYGEFDNGLVKINDQLEVLNGSTLSGAKAVMGQSTYTFGTNYGGYFTSAASSGIGIYAEASGNNAQSYGAYFKTSGTSSHAAYGIADNTAGNYTYGGRFISRGTNGRGVSGFVDNGLGNGYGGHFTSNGINGTGVYASGLGGNGIGIYAQGVQRAAIFEGEVESNGHLHINAPTGSSDAQIFMTTATGTESRVLIKQNTTDDIYLGDLDTGGGDGDVFIRTNGTDKMRIQGNGKVGIGTNSPGDRLEVIADAGESALRVKVGTTTRFRIHSNGGASIGVNSTPVAEGLKVKNLDVVGDGPLRADGSGNIYKDQTVYYASFNPSGFYENNIDPIFGSADQKILHFDFSRLAINLPDHAHLQNITMNFYDNAPSEVHLYLKKATLSGNTHSDVVEVFSVGTPGYSYKTESFSHTVDNGSYSYYLQARMEGPTGGQVGQLRSVRIGYTLSAL